MGDPSVEDVGSTHSMTHGVGAAGDLGDHPAGDGAVGNEGIEIIGREISAGVFDFLDGNVFDISAGEGGLEPVQLAVRALIERATVEFMANLYGAPGPEVCLNAGPDPLGGTVGPTGGYYAAYPNTDTNNGETRADPSRWHDRRDGAVRRSRY